MFKLVQVFLAATFTSSAALAGPYQDYNRALPRIAKPTQNSFTAVTLPKIERIAGARRNDNIPADFENVNDRLWNIYITMENGLTCKALIVQETGLLAGKISCLPPKSEPTVE